MTLLLGPGANQRPPCPIVLPYDLGHSPGNWVLDCSMANCQNCGAECAPLAAVCSQCGAKLKVAAPVGGQTMLGMASPFTPPSEAVPHQRALAGTMVGMPSPLAGPPSDQPTELRGAHDTVVSATEAVPPRRALSGTMVGMPSPVARSPSEHGEPDPPELASHNQPTGTATFIGNSSSLDALRATEAQGSRFALDQTTSAGSIADGPGRRFDGTLLGVAQPGIAPNQDAFAAPPQALGSGAVEPSTSDTPTVPDSPNSGVVPARAPTSPGRPMWQTASFIAAGLLAAAGLGGLFAKMSKADVQVNVTRFSVDETGHDQLELKCPECPEQTTLRIAESTCKFSQGTCTLVVGKPLSLGQNEFDLSLVAADGEILSADPLLVPVAFRMASSWKGRQASPPYGEIVIEAPAGSRIQVNGEPVADAAGKATYRVELDKESLGEAREAHKIALDVPIEVTTGDKVRSTRATLRSSITPLQLTSLGPVHQLSGKTLTVTGLSTPGAKISLGHATTTANEHGEFTLSLTTPSEFKGFVEARAEDQLTRRVPVELTQAATLPDPVTDYAQITAPVFVQLSATVIESRVAGGVTRSLLEIQEDCKNTPCLISTIYAEPKHLLPNRNVTVSGWATPGDPVLVKVVKFLAP